MKAKLIASRVIIALIFAILAVRLWELQINRCGEYRLLADKNRFQVVPIDAPRGIIYDRGGRVLARNIPSFTVTIVPAYLPKDEAEKEAVFTRLSSLLGIPASARIAARGSNDPPLGIEEMVERGKDSPFRPIPIARGIDRNTAFIIEEEHLDLPGVRLQIDPIRQYPTGALTSNIIGYMGHIPPELIDEYTARGYDPSSDKVGLTGVELTLEGELRGRKGSKYIEVDAAGREIKTVGEPQPPQPGHSLVLTIDLDLQQAMADALQKGLEKARSNSGVAIAMDPRTGEILGMVSLPSYDNNLFAGGISAEDYQKLESDPYHPLVNHAISGQYPPGSTIKIIHAAAALEEGVINKRTRLDCPGIIWLPNKYFPNDPKLAQPFYCWIHEYGHGHGPLNVVEAIAYSCDIFFYKVGGGFGDFEGLGLERLTRYARLFGLGEETGIALPGEAKGLVPSAQWKRINYAESWTTGDTYNISIGQGFILVTPLQLLNATAAIANGGTLYRPELVYKVIDAEGNVIRPFIPEVIRRIPVSKRNLAIVREGMRASVEWGEAQRANLPQVAVAGKTGTAEYPGPRDEKGNLPTHAWFVAFAPYENPEIAVVVFVYGGTSGAKVAAPIAKEILRYYFGLPEPTPP